MIEPTKRATAYRKACELCRGRKIRCSGEISGCDRCKASAVVCKYPSKTLREKKKRGSDTQTTTVSNEQDFTLSENGGSICTGILEDQDPSLSPLDSQGLTITTQIDIHSDNDGFFDDIVHQGGIFDTIYDGRLRLLRQGMRDTHMLSNDYVWNEIVSTDGSSDCKCLSHVARLIYQVETQTASLNLDIDISLNILEECLQQYDLFISCSSCKSRSECTLLLAILAKSLSVVCKGLVQRCIRDWSGNLSEQNDWPEVRIGTHMMMDSDEKSTIVQTLVRIKLGCLQKLLIDLRVRLTNHDGHLILLVQIEERIKHLQSLIP